MKLIKLLLKMENQKIKHFEKQKNKIN